MKLLRFALFQAALQMLISTTNAAPAQAPVAPTLPTVAEKTTLRPLSLTPVATKQPLAGSQLNKRLTLSPQFRPGGLGVLLRLEY